MAKMKDKRPQAVSGNGGWKAMTDRAFPWMLGPVLFVAMTCSSRLVAVLLAAVFLALTVGRGCIPALRERLAPLSLAVVLYSTLCLLSGLWCHFGEAASRETGKTLAALAVFGLVLFRLKKDSVRNLLHQLTAVLSVVALLCLDASGTQLLTRVFAAAAKLLQFTVKLSAVGYEEGVRITGIYSNANVSGGILAFGLLVCLYLLRTAVSKREQLLVALGLGTQALAFFLSFSMGSMAAFAVACLVYVVCAGKGERFPLFLLMLESVAVTVLCSFAAFPLLGGGMVGAALWVLGPVTGFVILMLDRLVGSRLAAALAGRDRLLGVFAGALAVLAAVYVVLALRMTGGTVLTGGEVLERAVDPAPGTYTVALSGVDADVRIYTQNEADLMMHTETTLYEGPLSQAAFTVPGDSEVVWFQLSGEGALDAVTLSDGTSLPLGYTLLPAFAANRLQALWANQNFIQRLVFFRDGLELWKASPLLGWGIGGVEGQLTSVQDFFYETKYIHNHYIQTLDEVGIPGFLSFAAMLGCAVWLLVSRRREQDPLVPMMAAVLAMTFVHSMVEVVWSTQPYQTVVFVLFAAMVVQLWEPRWEALSSEKAVSGTAAAFWAVVLAFGVLLGGNRVADARFNRMNANEMSPNEVLSAMRTLDTLDIYADTPYKTNLMIQHIKNGQVSSAGGYATQLSRQAEFDSAYYVAGYYHLTLRNLSGLFDVLQTGVLQERSNPDAWNSAFRLLSQCAAALEADYVPEFLAGVRETGELLEQVNGELMAPVVLGEEQQILLNAARSLEGVDAASAHTALALLLEK